MKTMKIATKKALAFVLALCISFLGASCSNSGNFFESFTKGIPKAIPVSPESHSNSDIASHDSAVTEKSQESSENLVDVTPDFISYEEWKKQDPALTLPLMEAFDELAETPEKNPAEHDSVESSAGVLPQLAEDPIKGDGEEEHPVASADEAKAAADAAVNKELEEMREQLAVANEKVAAEQKHRIAAEQELAQMKINAPPTSDAEMTEALAKAKSDLDEMFERFQKAEIARQELSLQRDENRNAKEELQRAEEKLTVTESQNDEFRERIKEYMKLEENPKAELSAKTQMAANIAPLFFTAQPAQNLDKKSVGKEHLVGVFTTSLEGSVTLGDFASLGHVTSNVSGTLKITDPANITKPIWEGEVETSGLSGRRDANQTTIRVDSVERLSQGATAWRLIFIPSEQPSSGTESALKVSMASASLRNGGQVATSAEPAIWTMNIAKQPVPETELASSKKVQTPVAKLDSQDSRYLVIAGILALLGIVTFAVICMFLKKSSRDRHASAADPEEEVVADFSSVKSRSPGLEKEPDADPFEEDLGKRADLEDDTYRPPISSGLTTLPRKSGIPEPRAEGELPMRNIEPGMVHGSDPGQLPTRRRRDRKKAREGTF